MHHDSDISGMKVAILLDQQYEDLEFWYPYYRLKEEGCQVVAVSAKAGETYPSKHGYPAKSDVSAGDVKAGDFDAVVVPGGFSPDFMRRQDSMVNFIRDAADARIPIACICHGVWMLCCTGALRGRNCTSYKSIRYDVENAGGRWVDKECVRDGPIITSRTPADLVAFCRTLIDAMAEAHAPAGAK